MSKVSKMALFHPHHKFKVHLVQLFLAVVIIALSVARLLLSGQKTRTRASTMGLGMVRIDHPMQGGTFKSSIWRRVRNIGCQIAGHHPLPARDGTCFSLPTMGEPESIPYSEFAGDSLLGRGGVPRLTGKSPGVCGYRLCPGMGGDRAICKHEVSKLKTTGKPLIIWLIGKIYWYGRD